MSEDRDSLTSHAIMHVYLWGAAAYIVIHRAEFRGDWTKKDTLTVIRRVLMGLGIVFALCYMVRHVF